MAELATHVHHVQALGDQQARVAAASEAVERDLPPPAIRLSRPPSGKHAHMAEIAAPTGRRSEHEVIARFERRREPLFPQKSHDRRRQEHVAVVGLGLELGMFPITRYCQRTPSKLASKSSSAQVNPRASPIRRPV
jgi:hypothetical protein